MSIIGLNPDKCAQRNRLAAKRDGVNAVPMQFLKTATSVGAGVTSAQGTLPKSDAEALARINALRGEQATPLTLDDVYIHYAEAANGSFIADRYAFLSTKTLKNIARDAQAGFAFMNSHRTGGLSHESELPYGRTFAGRYEKAEDGSERALIGFYMLRGQYPNGASGPSTDALHTGIEGGTIFDVSVGLFGGQAVCDVCGGDVASYRDCPHVPGTDYDLSDEEMTAQRERGVPDGFASYTLDDSHCGETSAVYDGAVAGAGFNKALAFARQGKLDTHTLAQARHAYAPLLSKGELPMDSPGIATAIQDGLTAVLQRFGLRPQDEQAVGVNPRTEHAYAPTSAAPIDPDPPVAPHPVLTAALSAQIETPEQFAALVTDAANGRLYLAAERDKAKKLAVAVFGNATEDARAQVEAAHTFVDAAPLGQVQQMAAQYTALAVKLGLAHEDGSALTRLSAPSAPPNFAQDVQPSPAPQTPPVVLERVEDSFARRKREVEAARQGR